MMHWSLLVLVLTLAGCIVTGPALASSPTVMISNYTVTPAVLMPGDTGTISFVVRTTDSDARIQNTAGATAGGSSTVQNTAINVFIHNIHVEGNGIAVLSGDFDRVGDLGPGQSIPITVLVRAPEQEGMYFPEIWIDTGTGFATDGSSTRFPVPVNVNTRISLLKKPDLRLEKTLPQSVVPGTDFPAVLRIRNNGTGRADDITVTVNASLASLALESPSAYHLDLLAPGESVVLPLNFTTSRDSALGIRSVPVTVSYANADGSRETVKSDMGIPVRGKASLAVKSLTTDPLRPAAGDAITLVIRAENTGTDRATGVKAVLDTPLSGTKEAFIGSIDKDSDAPAIFYLNAPSAGGVPVGLSISYNDDYGSHTLEENVTVTVGQKGNAGIAVAALIAVAAGVILGYWYLHYRRKGDHA
jgi:hypothetical protein